MGIYIYTLRKPLRPVMLRGVTVMMANFKYLRKPYFTFGELDRTSKMLISKVSGLFPKVPEYVVFGDWEIGDPVLRWKGKAWMLDDKISGYEVGKLKSNCEVEVSEFTRRTLKWVEEGEKFQFGKVSVQLFNKAMNTNYTKDDWFTMMDHGRFCYGTEVYGVYALPLFSSDWLVIVK